jgi:hypothetical protein
MFNTFDDLIVQRFPLQNNFDYMCDQYWLWPNLVVHSNGDGATLTF